MAAILPAALVAEKPSQPSQPDQRHEGFWGFALMIHDKLKSMDRNEAEKKIAELTTILYRPAPAASNSMATFNNFYMNWQ